MRFPGSRSEGCGEAKNRHISSGLALSWKEIQMRLCKRYYKFDFKIS